MRTAIALSAVLVSAVFAQGTVDGTTTTSASAAASTSAAPSTTTPANGLPSLSGVAAVLTTGPGPYPTWWPILMSYDSIAHSSLTQLEQQNPQWSALESPLSSLESTAALMTGSSSGYVQNYVSSAFNSALSSASKSIQGKANAAPTMVPAIGGVVAGAVGIAAALI